jgi:cysteine desulfurase
MEKRLVYMDNNATTPLHPEVKKAITEGMEVFGNASSFHSFGRTARNAIENAREEIAGFIGASPDEIIFVGSGSEANNTVLNMFACSSSLCQHAKCGRVIVTSTIEHPCILETAKCLQGLKNEVIYLDVDKYGKVKMNRLEEILSTRSVGLVSVMLANNEIGTIQDVKKISELGHKYSCHVHTDAVQALGKISVDVSELGVDYLSLSGHKVYGPKGVGALYVRKGKPFCAYIRGGHQEKGRRAGTENTLGIVGFGKAVAMAKKEMDRNRTSVLNLKKKLKDGIQSQIPDIRLNGHPEDCLPNTLNVSFDGAEGEAILLYMDLEGIAVSTGSACSSGSLDPSHVLLATGLEAERAHGSIRFSLGRDNTEADVDYVLDKLPRIIERIRKMSTAYTFRRG